MPLELAPESYTAPGRPSVITTKDGAKIYLHIHDAAYMRERAAWKRRLMDAHPDRGGTPAKFRDARAAQMRWQLAECLFYSRLGLLPPDNKVLRGLTVYTHGQRRYRAFIEANIPESEDAV